MEKRLRIHPSIRNFASPLRKPQTPAEATLSKDLRNRNLGHKFRRQHAIEFFIIDFYCPQVKLCIEIDGDTHLTREQQNYDSARTEYLESLGRKVIRFTNNDVRFNIHAVVKAIIVICNELKVNHCNHPSP